MSLPGLLFHALALLAAGGVAVHALVNHVAQPRLARMPVPRRLPRVSVLIPARNEAARIEACVAAWCRQRYPEYEVVVYDDDSSDRTADVAQAATRGCLHARVVRGHGLPEGWRGKAHACHRLRGQARGELLIFADADVTPGPDALLRAAGAFEALGVDALSAVPSHTSPSLAVRVLVALQNWAAVALAPSWLDPGSRRPWLAALNGQFVAIDATVYDASGGFASVRDTLAEDVALGRRLARLGYRVRLAAGGAVLACEPYTRLGDLWRGNVRNLLPIFFGSRALLVAALGALAVVSLGPPALLAAGLILGGGTPLGSTWLPFLEVTLALASRAVTDRRAGYPPWLALTHPIAVAALLLMGLDAVVRSTFRGAVQWRGRDYVVAETPGRRSAQAP